MKDNTKLKRNLLIAFMALIITLALTGCTQPKGDVPHEFQKIPKMELRGVQHPYVVVIDSCEYVYVQNGNASWGAHKGNCSFCKERNKQ